MTNESIAPRYNETVVYVIEDAMDCLYNCESTDVSKHSELAASPEMFESDIDDVDELDSTTVLSSLQCSAIEVPFSPKKPTREELVLESDRCLLTRIHKFLSGVPPPPNHTISQSDCDDFLVYIRQNRGYFWADPFDLELSEEKQTEIAKSTLLPSKGGEKNDVTILSRDGRLSYPSKAGLRNLTTAFDACQQLSNSKGIEFFETMSTCIFSERLFNASCSSAASIEITARDQRSKLYKSEESLALYRSTTVEEIASLTWPQVQRHKCHDL